MARVINVTLLAQGAVGFRSTLRRPSTRTRSTSASSSDYSSWDDGATEGPLPCLLTSAAPAFKVKNTFIDDFAPEDLEEDDGLPLMGKSWTWSGFKAAHVGDDDDKEALLLGDRQIMAMAPLRPAAPVQQVPAVEIAPLEQRQPEESAGSVDHAFGTCRPCAWFWREQGCTNGSGCYHCHLCAAGEVKKRRKANKRASARLRRVADLEN